MTRVDLLLVGGGLANGLLAARLRALRPELSLLVLEAGERPGGNHTWSFHETDLAPEARKWVDPFVAHRWPAYDVLFPDRCRTVPIGYRSITSERFAATLGTLLGDAVRCDAPVAEIGREGVRLRDGTGIEAGAVLDGRGPRETAALRLAWQKFVGQEVRLSRPHGLAHPVLMDATVPQLDGYRFVYLLPFDERTLLVEDTYYSDGPELDAPLLRGRVATYLAARGWTVSDVLREEEGVLPVVLDGDMDAFWRDGLPGIARTGLRAGLLHPTTGYSLPDAVRLADHVARLPDLSGPALAREIERWSRRQWRGRGFFRLLNRMLFRAGAPAERFRVLQRFYGLPPATISRFYSGRLSLADMARLLVGKPPVPIGGALRALWPNRALGASS